MIGLNTPGGIQRRILILKLKWSETNFISFRFANMNRSRFLYKSQPIRCCETHRKPIRSHLIVYIKHPSILTLSCGFLGNRSLSLTSYTIVASIINSSNIFFLNFDIYVKNLRKGNRRTESSISKCFLWNWKRMTMITFYSFKGSILCVGWKLKY